MKSFEQIAKAMYSAWCAEAARQSGKLYVAWSEQAPHLQQAWIAAARQAAAELSTVH